MLLLTVAFWIQAFNMCWKNIIIDKWGPVAQWSIAWILDLLPRQEVVGANLANFYFFISKMNERMGLQ